MDEEPENPAAQPLDRNAAREPGSDEYLRGLGGNRSFLGKLFPGPTAEASSQVRARMRELAESSAAERHRNNRQSHHERRSVEGQVAPPPTVDQPPTVTPASADDVAALAKLLDEQNEILRAVLTNSIGTLEDARSTAQNSRTFAWAGIAIAFLTFVATVLAVVAAVAHWG